MKKDLIIATVIVFCFSVLGCCKPPCFDCGMAKKGPCGSSCKSSEGCCIERCLLKAPCFAIMNKKEIDLSAEQEAKIKQLCTETKKKHIKLKADADIICVDIKSKLFEDTTNAAEVNKLIDQKYDLKKQDTKLVINSFIQLKQILTAEQRAKLKELRENCRKGKCCKGCK